MTLTHNLIFLIQYLKNFIHFLPWYVIHGYFFRSIFFVHITNQIWSFHGRNCLPQDLPKFNADLIYSISILQQLSNSFHGLNLIEMTSEQRAHHHTDRWRGSINLCTVGEVVDSCPTHRHTVHKPTETVNRLQQMSFLSVTAGPSPPMLHIYTG